MNVVISGPARDYLKGHGGVLYVRALTHRCCTGPITLLQATTKAPDDASLFVPVGTGDVDIRVHGAQPGLHELKKVDLRGVVRKHPVAFWNGRAYNA